MCVCVYVYMYVYEDVSEWGGECVYIYVRRSWVLFVLREREGEREREGMG